MSGTVLEVLEVEGFTDLRLKTREGELWAAISSAPVKAGAEIVAKRADLKGKPVQVRGQVVKFTPGARGKNWIHLRDGTGSAADGTNDLTITTMAETRVGDVVLVKAMVRTDRDLGSGYAYKVLIEDATLQK